MDLVLIPGFWLDGSSWSGVTPALEAAGHTVHPLTLPGLEAVDAARSGITLRDHVDAVIEAVDALTEPVVLIGHSGGGAIAWAVADARPDRIARIVYVDSGPLPHGGVINDELPGEHGEVPLPDWSAFEGELADFTEETLAQFRARAIPQPERVTSDKQVLSDERRYAVPATVITTTFPEAKLREMLEQGHSYFAELAKVEHFEVVELPTSHWPQFTKPDELAELIVAALR
ncbi:MAG: alpha/beta fold hydrolase [Actinomycetota bacterium]|nr:alpha/beta fold hydrolase [Actinomycetota bacterium]